MVTGSSSGIGRAIALELAAAGADVLVHAATNRTGAEQTAAAIRQLGRRSEIILADLSEQAAQDALLEQAWDWRGGFVAVRTQVAAALASRCGGDGPALARLRETNESAGPGHDYQPGLGPG